MTRILKNHFALHRTNYLKGLAAGRYNTRWPDALSMRRIEATSESLHAQQLKVDPRWGWVRQGRYHDPALPARLAHPETALYELVDGHDAVGFTLVTAPAPALRERFFGAADYPVIEIENLGMYQGCEGGGRGKSYFEMHFARYFPRYEAVYWSQHETHSPTLRRFYQEKMGMALLATDRVPDFRAPAARAG